VKIDHLLENFLTEVRELLGQMEAALLTVDPATPEAETINEIFRVAHTIKGTAGMFRLEHTVTFTHAVESVLDAVRDGRDTLEPELVTLLLSCADYIGVLIDAVESGRSEPDETTQQLGEPLLMQLRQRLGTAGAEEVGLTLARAEEKTQAVEVVDAGRGNHWHISLRFSKEVLRNGMDPISFIRYLRKLGTITGIVTLPDGIPAAAEMDPEACYLGFEIALKSQADKTAIANVFEFVRDDCSLRILPPSSRVAEYIRLIKELPEEVERLGEILVRCGTVTAEELEAALASQREHSAPAPPIGEILIDQGIVRPAVVEAALAKQQQTKETKLRESHSIRIDADKLDHLISLVGELIIAAASADVIGRSAHVPELRECTATLARLVEAVRDSTLQLRMVKIGATFSRFQRVVHDVSREIGKEIRLVVSGEDTELDKTVVERIADPLTHLVRNAMDHGLEPPELRRERGKPAVGTVGLNAYHDAGSIVIEVSDDGGGLKRDKILAKAVERGLVEAGRTLTDAEVHDLIFEPGFSTAEQITNLSGRGVGMDVVKRNITALRGSVSVRSEVGAGTTVAVRLPLTLAIINGFLVGLGKSVFVVPLDMIEECVELSAQPGHDYTNLRGRVLPFIRLREMFAVEGEPGQRQNVVVVKHAGHKAGLVVDTLLGEFQTVIKPLNKMFNRVKCISGSSILGTGEVALILDVPTLVQQASQRLSGGEGKASCYQT
jgi:two-component system, chemotaxis family, sensor kinase CheA